MSVQGQERSTVWKRPVKRSFFAKASARGHRSHLLARLSWADCNGQGISQGMQWSRSKLVATRKLSTRLASCQKGSCTCIENRRVLQTLDYCKRLSSAICLSRCLFPLLLSNGLQPNSDGLRAMASNLIAMLLDFASL